MLIVIATLACLVGIVILVAIGRAFFVGRLSWRVATCALPLGCLCLAGGGVGIALGVVSYHTRMNEAAGTPVSLKSLESLEAGHYYCVVAAADIAATQYLLISPFKDGLVGPPRFYRRPSIGMPDGISGSFCFRVISIEGRYVLDDVGACTSFTPIEAETHP